MKMQQCQSASNKLSLTRPRQIPKIGIASSKESRIRCSQTLTNEYRLNIHKAVRRNLTTVAATLLPSIPCFGYCQKCNIWQGTRLLQDCVQLPRYFSAPSAPNPRVSLTHPLGGGAREMRLEQQKETAEALLPA